MTDSAYRVGIVGCGSISDRSHDELLDVPGWIPLPYSHAQTLEAHERTVLVAAMDPDVQRLDEFAARWQVTTGFGSITQMIAEQRLDIVTIASPTRFHAEHFMEAVAAGIKGVFLEKPVARTLRDVDRMIDTAHRSFSITSGRLTPHTVGSEIWFSNARLGMSQEWSWSGARASPREDATSSICSG